MPPVETCLVSLSEICLHFWNKEFSSRFLLNLNGLRSLNKMSNSQGLKLTHNSSYIKQGWKVSSLFCLKMCCKWKRNHIKRWCGKIEKVWFSLHMCVNTDQYWRCREEANTGKCSWPAWQTADREKTPPLPVWHTKHHENHRRKRVGNPITPLYHPTGCWMVTSQCQWLKSSRATPEKRYLDHFSLRLVCSSVSGSISNMVITATTTAMIKMLNV